MLAACGDSGSDSRGDSMVPTTMTQVFTTQDTPGTEETTPTGGSEDSGSGGASQSTTVEPTTDPVATEPTSASTTAPMPTTVEPTTVEPTTVPPDDTTTTGAVDDAGVDDTTGPGQKFDIPPPVCLQCGLTIASQQSGTFAIGGDAVFATAQLQGQIVYALGTYGSGRFIATADSSLPFNEQTDCPLSEWLAANGGGQPKILYFGWGPSDGPKQWNVPADASGIHLPAQYVGNPAQLRADYDIVMYLEGSGQFDGGDQPSDQEVSTLLDYMSGGGGLYISSEFYGYMTAADLVSVNRLLSPLGITSQAVSLNWGNVDGNINFECFPEPQ